MTHLASYKCGADANALIETLFGDCVYTAWDITAFCIGLSSVFFWIIAQLPQFIKNILQQSVDALSPWFLLQWFLGDTFNFLGCMLTGNQLATQTVTAGYFIFADIIILTQYAYYQIRNKNKSYLDFDESLHKQSCRYPEQNIHISAVEKLLEANRSKAAVPSDGSSKGYHVAYGALPHIHGNHGKNIHGFCQEANLDAGGRKLAGEVDTRSKVSKTNDAWMYEQWHRLRRLTQVYGLEYGHALTVHFNRLHKHLQSERLSKQSWRFRRRPVRGRYKALLGIACFCGIVFGKAHIFQPMTRRQSVQSAHSLGRRVLLSLRGTSADAHLLLSSGTCWMKVMGSLVGWASSVLYLGSRFSQLVKNKQRRSAEGLSLGMVACAILANTTYGASILMRTPSWQYLIDKAPWLCGSLGTVFLDLSIVMQAQYYSCHLKKGVETEYETEYTPLLA